MRNVWELMGGCGCCWRYLAPDFILLSPTLFLQHHSIWKKKIAPPSSNCDRPGPLFLPLPIHTKFKKRKKERECCAISHKCRWRIIRPILLSAFHSAIISHSFLFFSRGDFQRFWNEMPRPPHFPIFFLLLPFSVSFPPVFFCSGICCITTTATTAVSEWRMRGAVDVYKSVLESRFYLYRTVVLSEILVKKLYS